MGQYTKIDNAYNFLSSTNEFNFDELKNASGWTIANTKANISKKLKGFLTNGDNKDYKIKEIFKTYSKDDFRSVFSQKYIVSIPSAAEKLLNKSKDCILTAIQNYNNPTIEYKLGSFITLSFIGFSSLLYAIFERDSTIKYIKPNGDFIPLIEALNKYKNFPDYNKKYNKGYLKNEVIRNIEGLRDFRNDIEHSYCELIELDLFPLCQKLLLDYQRILLKEFGKEHNISNKLSLALQFVYQYSYTTQKQNKEYIELKEKIKKHIDSAFGNYPVIIPLMIPAEEYSNLNLNNLNADVSAQIIALIQNEKRISSTDAVNEINNYLITELNFTLIKFDHTKLATLTKNLGWRGKNNKILDNKYLGNDELRKNNNIYYKIASLTFIKEKLKNNTSDVFKKALTQNQFNKFFNS